MDRFRDVSTSPVREGLDDDDDVRPSSTAIVLHPAPSPTTSYAYAPPAPQRYRGLSNQGATCYMNSLLQTLYMTPEFRNRLYQSKLTATTDLDVNIPFQLQKLFANLQLSKERKAIDTKALTKSFGWNSSDVFQQHDVQELCRVLFDALEESFKGTPDEQMVNELYQGTLKDYVQCAKCGNESSRLDNFLDLSLVIRPFGSTQMMRSVEEAIEFFLKPEMLSGDNQWDCDKCRSKQDAIKGLKFAKLPYLLSLQLKRFDFDYVTFNRIKLNNQVTFPKYLNMNTYDPTSGAVARKMSLERLELSEETPRRVSLDATDDDEDGVDGVRDSWHPDFDVEALAADGPFVYELFSVLIHSGSAMGGHYYAYIKSFEDDAWYNFNDSNVSKITEAEVRTAWGPAASPVASTGNYYYRSSHSTCAYMLMYRQVDARRNGHFLPDDALPSFLQDLITADEARRLVKEKEREERARLIPLKIFHDGSHKTLHVSKLLPLSDVVAQAITLFGLDFPTDRVRLRSYSEYTSVPLETYDGREMCSLAQLQIYAHCALFLEVRASVDEAWEAYDPTALQLLLRRYVPSTATTPEHFTEPPVSVQVPEEATLGDLLSLLSTKFGIEKDHLRVLQMSSSSYWSIVTTILNPTNDEATLQQTLRMDLKLRQGIELYVEECDTLTNWSLAKELFEARAHMITLQVKTKEKTLLAAKGVDAKESGMSWPFQVDRRENLQVLKDKLCVFFDLKPDDFKLCRNAEKGQELKAMDTSFKNLTLMDNSNVYVVLGTPLRVGEFSVQVHLFTPKATGEDEASVVLPPWMHANELSLCTKLIVSSATPIADMKARILTALHATHPDAKHLRLRDLLSSRRLSRVLADSLTLGEASALTLYENREFAVQILDAVDTLPSSHTLFSVVLFDRSTLRFGRRVEISFSTETPGVHWMDALLAELERVFNIPSDAIQIAKPPQTSDVDVNDIQETPWIRRDEGLRFHHVASLATYGDRLVIADTRVPLKELSKEESIALQALIDQATENDMLGIGGTPSAAAMNVYGPSLPSSSSSYYRGGYVKPKETALFIRTNKAPSGKSSSDSSHSVPVSPITGHDDDETPEDKEFARSGGADVFTDLH
ncbi:hypothetical protein SPRG_12891 [Saprolegnia parasitica CBS 223.65]|uniref:USP domain-containing protein n=1 Tax=Saprolegnia parasitica (strain CBS 223.65) TaxID=695850 RepID=A0A067BXT7_SAPPC|nr:hypothetical protein SPRG_12891 [Saprolegnia parasitica CBS 223.65]KDO21650.1 hypothetical protein SPRG_12891 [Saprolegnia parasitica CBS 223.65]|eukprot:XP_012207662.1 hypothetical protein SPRG_12891 [Saprolegnia parasitica CBS 223.65]